MFNLSRWSMFVCLFILSLLVACSSENNADGPGTKGTTTNAEQPSAINKENTTAPATSQAKTDPPKPSTEPENQSNKVKQESSTSKINQELLKEAKSLLATVKSKMEKKEAVSNEDYLKVRGLPAKFAENSSEEDKAIMQSLLLIYGINVEYFAGNNEKAKNDVYRNEYNNNLQSLEKLLNGK